MSRHFAGHGRDAIKMFGKDNSTFHFERYIDLFSLNASQLYVGYLKNGHGDASRGLRLVGASYVRARTKGEHDYHVTPDDAERLLKFLETILDHALPASFQFPPEIEPGLFDDGAFEWAVTGFNEKWHGGGAFEGTLGGDSGHKITKSSVERLQKCVRQFFVDAA